MVEKKADLRQALEVLKENNWFGYGRARSIWNEKSRNTLMDDMGEYDDSLCYAYDMDEITRDRLIAHARQDAAMAFYAASDAHREASAARRWSWFSFLLILAVLYKVW